MSDPKSPPKPTVEGGNPADKSNKGLSMPVGPAQPYDVDHVESDSTKPKQSSDKR